MRGGVQSVVVGVAPGTLGARLAYALKLVLGEVLGVSYRVVEGEEAWAAAEGSVGIGYGAGEGWRRWGNGRGVQVVPSGLLVDGLGLPDRGLEAWGWTAEGLPFAAGPERGCDFFAWAFWTAARCEELLPSAQGAEARDGHGRFRAEASEQMRYGWVDAPVFEQRVRAWARGWGWEVPVGRGFRVVPTVDVDSALMYRGKGWFRGWGGGIRQGLRGDFAGLRERVAVVRGRQEDPFDTYGDLLALHREVGWPGRWFVLVADRGPHDRGMDWRSAGLREVVARLAGEVGPGGEAALGLHPGYASHARPERIRQEKLRLESMSGLEIRRARQHYLLQRLPDAWEALEAAGIREDHSLGFADRVGLRTGLARPFPAYSVRLERELNLRVHPVHVMEATLARYMGLAPDASTLQRVLALAATLREVEGEFVTLWHNETAQDREPWAGWWTFYQEMLRALARGESGRILEP